MLSKWQFDEQYDNADGKEEDGVVEGLQYFSAILPSPLKKEKKKQQLSRTIDMGKLFTTSSSEIDDYVSRLYL